MGIRIGGVCVFRVYLRNIQYTPLGIGRILPDILLFYRLRGMGLGYVDLFLEFRFQGFGTGVFWGLELRVELVVVCVCVSFRSECPRP